MSLVIQPDGKIVAAGSFAENNTGGVVLLRRNPDGTPDTTFGTNGVVYSSVNNVYRSSAIVALQSDGKILLADDDQNGFDFRVERYNTDGTLDTTFGSGGISNTDIAGIDAPTDLAIQSDGKIVVTGPSQGYGYGLAVLRLNTNGSVDTSFGTGGVYANGAIEGEQSVVFQSDGKLIVGGALDQGCSPCGDFAILRLDTNGTLDTTFGSGGIASTNLSGADRIKDLEIEPDDSIVAVGGVGFGFSGAGETGIVRFLANGALDPSFGTGGKVILDLAPADLEEPEQVIIEPSGVITVVGSQMFRLTSTGALDTSFGTGGVIGSNGGNWLRRQTDGRLVVAGSYQNDFAIFRYFNNVCGNGTLEPGEACDDTNLIDGDGCDSNCTVTACGNGIVSTGEGCDDGNTVNGDGCSSVCQLEPTPTPTATPTDTPTRTPTPTPSPTLTPIPTATPACGDGTLDPGEECDDGNLLDGDCCSSTCQLVHHPSCLDHFFCYQAKTTAGTTKFAPQTGVSLVDRFGSTTATVKGPNRLCAPANKLGEDPTASSHADHLEGYPVKAATKIVVTGNQPVTNQFGSLILAVKKPVDLLVPTAKSQVATPPAPTTTLDHFRCYQAKEASGTSKFVPVPNVTVQDQFGTKTVYVKKPTRLCVPVDKNSESIGTENHPNHLVCYQVKDTSLTKFTTVTPLYTSNQFGSETIDAKKPAELCVPSYANPHCGNGVIDPGELCDGGPCCTATCSFAPNSPCLRRFSGVATNVPVASLTGWTQCFSGTYAATRNLGLLLLSCSQTNLLLGCRPVGSPDLQIAAEAPRTDVLFDTGTSDTPHVANGVGWYFNSSWSWGFAPQGAAIHRNQCDVVASSFQSGTDPNLRLCWHTNSNTLNSGWRCGADDQLNNSTTFERIIFQAP